MPTQPKPLLARPAVATALGTEGLEAVPGLSTVVQLPLTLPSRGFAAMTTSTEQGLFPPGTQSISLEWLDGRCDRASPQDPWLQNIGSCEFLFCTGNSSQSGVT